MNKWCFQQEKVQSLEDKILPLYVSFLSMQKKINIVWEESRMFYSNKIKVS